MMLRKTPIALAAALAVQFHTAIAATAPLDEPAGAVDAVVTITGKGAAPYNPSTSTSALKIDAPLRDIPQTVNVIPEQLLRDQRALSMEDAMKSIPGVGLSHGDGQRDQVTLRGFSAIADQFVDGLRDDALYFRDLSNIERIEVLKGPAAVLYGRGSSGGLINRITKKPGSDTSEVAVTVGSHDQRRGEVDIARKLGDNGMAFRVTGAIERSDSYRDQQFLERDAIAPSLLLPLGASTTLLLQLEHLSDRRVTDFGIPSYQGRPVSVPAGTYYGAANARDADFSQAEVTAGGFTLEHRFSETLSVRNAFRKYDYTLDRNNTLVGSVNEAAKTASLNRTNLRREEDGWFNQTEITQTASLAGMTHKLLYGVEFGKQNKDQVNRSRNNVATVALFNPVLPVLPLKVDTAPSTDNLGIFTTRGGYVQDLVELTANWKALAGVRYDRFEQETRERRAGQPNLYRVDTAWSPRAGLVWQPTAAQSYYASYSKSFQPSAEAFALAANNAQIAPEETTNKEVGGKFDFLGGAVSATAALFRLERTNIKYTDPVTNLLVPVGTQRSDGLELTLAGQLGQGWEVWSGYSYLDAKVTSSPALDSSDNVIKRVPIEGKRATLTPRHSGNVWLAKSFGGGWRAGLGVNAVASRFANPGNTVTLPGYARVDAMVGYKIGAVDLQVNVNNLLDREYIVSGHGSSPNLNLPGGPRNVRVTGRYRF
ncbi:catecholate siderophore receptor [Pseudoduganella flava]|uniref:Catecholate siderophore receptor n=1 Tax=Pseudoduganella flava TaxID=871742 RepID=A0A562Q0C4_9BURK|nr:TonB-dependent siderophore receptor [Pseudoduganella flava]QGZ38343.1 TonB-dependent siderophore receptor [Pseudoduganella flava]TWI50117.1 catecholate siderophore receptor [Pseudoduganella flava]